MRRNELLDVAGALAGSFISRNNDVDGYWSLGLLRSYADSKHLRSLRFDIVSGTAEPEDRLLARVAEAYRQVLTRQLTTRRIAHEILATAEIGLTFGHDTPDPASGNTDDSPFSCTVRLTDHRDRSFERTMIGTCAPHDPRREFRSTRFNE